MLYLYNQYKQYKILCELLLSLLIYYCLKKKDINFIEFIMGLYLYNQHYYLTKFLNILKKYNMYKFQNKYLLHY